uniref:EGF-like domain-containing protein n=1 Tax=Labrus bergylta TaxID=56723 RepID=A0A3Q3N8P9_9LABR
AILSHVLGRNLVTLLSVSFDPTLGTTGLGGRVVPLMALLLVKPDNSHRSTQKCESTFDKYCLNNGLCMLLVDINEHHCKCEDGFYGPRCGNLELVFQPMAEEQILLTVFCVILLSTPITYSQCSILNKKVSGVSSRC